MAPRHPAPRRVTECDQPYLIASYRIRPGRQIFAADVLLSERHTCAQMSRFFRRITNLMARHPIGRTAADHPPFRNQRFRCSESYRFLVM
jgi:hypothetical protein